MHATLKSGTLWLFLCLMSSISGFSQDKGIQFFEGSWAGLLAKAKETGKPVFIDVYTSWCGPCKMMAKNIFPQQQVGEKYNASFINYKTDAEKGDGLLIAETFHVKSYPTYLYLDSNGELVHRSGGYNPEPALFIQQAETALEAVRDPYTIKKMTADFESGKRGQAFLKSYISRLSTLELENTQVVETYLNSLSTEEKKNPETLRFIAQHLKDARSPAFAYVMENRSLLAGQPVMDVESHASINNQLQNVLYNNAAEASRDKRWDDVAKFIKYAGQLPPMDEFYQDEFARLKMSYFQYTGQTDSLINVAVQIAGQAEEMTIEAIRAENARRYMEFMKPYLTGQKDSTKEDMFEKMSSYLRSLYTNSMARKLDLAARSICAAVDAKPTLKRALRWNAKAIVLMPEELPFLALSAKLLAKLDEKEKAKQMMEKVISRCQKSGDKESQEYYQKEYDNLMKE